MTRLPTLRIVATDSLRLHENHDPGRTHPLVTTLQRDGFLKNPPVIAPLDNGHNHYVVLDGANRVSAFTLMEYPHLLAQVVDYEGDGVQLSAWNHLVVSLSTQALLTRLQGLPGVNLREMSREDARRGLADQQLLCYLLVPEGGVMAALGETGKLDAWAETLCEVVNVYMPHGKIFRTQQDELRGLEDFSSSAAALVVFPNFRPNQVMDLARGQGRLPAGITRHLISPRALRVNYPLEELSAAFSLDEKNLRLQEWLHQKTVSQSVRFYGEATVLYDE
ncbi:MAG TPA: hypothetical protein VJJ70_05095 [Anaerolineales bacterium]|nr:hypothetical protein [Anaerolineales bacterium]